MWKAFFCANYKFGKNVRTTWHRLYCCALSKPVEMDSDIMKNSWVTLAPWDHCCCELELYKIKWVEMNEIIALGILSWLKRMDNTEFKGSPLHWNEILQICMVSSIWWHLIGNDWSNPAAAITY